MDQPQLAAAIALQIDALQSMVTSGVGIALVSLWAGLQDEEKIPIPFLSTSVSRNSAFVLLSSVFLFTNLTSLVYFLRLIDLVATANRDTVIALGAHPWSLNPFAFLGQAEATRWRDSIGYPAMIVIWWVGFIALTSIRAGGTKCQFLGVGVVLGIFVVVGLCAEFSMYDVLAALSERAPDLDVGSISDNVWSFPPGTMWSLHNCATWAGIVLSVAVFLALALFHPHLLPYLSRAIRLSKYTPPGRGSKPDSCCSVL